MIRDRMTGWVFVGSGLLLGGAVLVGFMDAGVMSNQVRYIIATFGMCWLVWGIMRGDVRP